MEIRRGAASSVRLGSELAVHSSESGTNVSTQHYATFDLNGTPVQARASRPLTLADGDDVLLAGRMKDGVFVAGACRNLTRGTIDHESWWVGLLVGTAFVIVGVGIALYMLLESGSDRWIALFGVAFAAVGGIALLMSLRQLVATSAVRMWRGHAE
jgi:hypothetical protein